MMAFAGRLMSYTFVLCLCGLVRTSAFNITNYCNSSVSLCRIVHTAYDETSSEATGETIPTMEEVFFEDSILKVIPNVFKYMPNLVHFSSENCRIKMIYSETFRDAETVKVLDLMLNNIGDLPSNVFMHMTNLQDVRLGHNHISIVYVDTFANASKITDLQLNGNKIQSLPAQVFWPLTLLEYIDLEYNQIEIIDGDLFKKNPRLRTVLLNNNQLLLFEENSLTHVPFLNLVDISYNQIHTITLNSINSLRASKAGLKNCNINGTVISLVANSNHLTRLNVKNFSLTTSIVLQRNQFETLRDFVDIDNLRKFDVSFNPIADISHLNFGHFKLLTELRLSGTNLSLHTGELSYLSSLTILDISNNYMNTIDLRLLQPLQKLEKLYLDGNSLKSLNFENLKQFHPSLNELGILNNIWNCSFLGKVVKYCVDNKVTLRVPPRLDKSDGDSIAGVKCNDNRIVISTTPQPSTTVPIECVSSSTHTLVVLMFVLVLTLFIVHLGPKVIALFKNRRILARNPFLQVNDNDVEEL